MCAFRLHATGTSERPSQTGDLTPETARSLGLGIALFLGSVAGFAVMNLMIKLVGDGPSAAQGVFFRNTIAACLMVPLIIRTTGISGFKTKRPGGHLLRAIVGILGVGCFFEAVTHTSLAQVTSISMSVPIFVTLMAIPLLGETVGWRRWSAILVGFGGVTLATLGSDLGGGLEGALGGKGALNFNTGSAFALLATVLWALTIVLVRRLSATEAPYTIVLYYMVMGAIITGLYMPFVWVPPSAEQLVYYLGAGVAGAAGQIFMTSALKLAPASVVSPLEYTSILWAATFDLSIWGVAPGPATLAGAGIVIATGLYIWHREARIRPPRDRA